MRFLRGGVAGATSLMLVLIYSGGYNWADVQTWLSALSIAGIVGFVSGIILAAEKWSRMKN